MNEQLKERVSTPTTRSKLVGHATNTVIVGVLFAMVYGFDNFIMSILSVITFIALLFSIITSITFISERVTDAIAIASVMKQTCAFAFNKYEGAFYDFVTLALLLALDYKVWATFYIVHIVCLNHGERKIKQKVNTLIGE